MQKLYLVCIEVYPIHKKRKTTQKYIAIQLFRVWIKHKSSGSRGQGFAG